jgi:hypothetical protein
MLAKTVVVNRMMDERKCNERIGLRPFNGTEVVEWWYKGMAGCVRPERSPERDDDRVLTSSPDLVCIYECIIQGTVPRRIGNPSPPEETGDSTDRHRDGLKSQSVDHYPRPMAAKHFLR